MRRHPNQKENKGGRRDSASFSCARNNSARKNPFRRQTERKKRYPRGVLYFVAEKRRRDTHITLRVKYSSSLDWSCVFFSPTPSLRYSIWAYSNLFRRHGERCCYIHLHSLFKQRKEGQITDVFRTDDSALCGRLSGPFLNFFFTPIYFFEGYWIDCIRCVFVVYARGHS